MYSGQDMHFGPECPFRVTGPCIASYMYSPLPPCESYRPSRHSTNALVGRGKGINAMQPNPDDILLNESLALTPRFKHGLKG